MMRIRPMLRITMLLMVAAVAAAPAPAGAGPGTSYGAPYGAGPTGPPASRDQWNVVMADPAQGSMTLVRANPVPGTFDCPGAGPYANFVVNHPIAGGEQAVNVAYDNAVLDNFTFLRIELRDVAADQTSRVVGFREIQGPIVAPAGSVDLVAGSSAWWDTLTPGDVLQVTFGLNTSSACLPGQSVDAGTITFASVTVS